MMLDSIINSQKALRESEARLERIAASVPGVIYQLRQRSNGRFRWTFRSSRCREFLEMDAKAIGGDGNLLLSMIHPEDVEEFNQSLRRSMESLQLWHWSGRLILPSGKVKWMQMSSKPEKMTNGDLIWDGLLLDITSEKEKETSMLANLEKIRSFVENTPAAVAMFDLQMRYLVASSRWLKENRLEEVDILGRSYYEIFPETPDRWKEIHQRCLAGAVEKCEDEPYPREDGTIEWVRWAMHPWRNNAGSIGGMIMFSEVITERKRSEIERDRFFNLSLDLLGIAGIDGYFKRVNPAVTRILGYTAPEFLQHPMLDFVHPEDQAVTQEKLNQLSSGLVLVDFENRYRCKDGSYKWLSWRAVPVESAGLIYAVGHDITDRKVAESTLKKLNEDLERMVGERTAELAYTNSILLEEIGDRKRAEEALRTSEKRLIEQKDQLENTSKELAYTNSILLEEIGDRKRAEEALRTSKKRLIEQKDQLEKTLSELQQAQIQLVNSEKMSSLGQLVAGVAHEINNPVGFISTNLLYVKDYVQGLLEHLNLYQQHYPNPVPEIREKAAAMDVEFMTTDLQKILDSMQVGTERIQQISVSLRNFSRSESSTKTPFNIHEGIDSTLLILKHRLKATQKRSEIKLIQEYGELPLVECYPGQLNQVFMNLLANAIDALSEYNTARQGIIRIRTEVIDDNWVAIKIADNGPGMTPEVNQQLFKARFTTKPVGKGTGLGLSISQSIVVEKHGGKLSCISAPDEGAEFVIEIPLR